MEDYAIIRRGLRAILERNGYQVLEARNGDEALLLYDDSVDLVLTDLNMPGMSGFQLLQQLLVRNPGLRFVLHTADDWIAVPRTWRKLIKPCSEETLLQTVTEALI